MDKIILKSLELAGFKNASEIALIISATPNPTIATEMLLGIYKPKNIKEFGQYWSDRYSDCLFVIKSIDELNDKITYDKISQKTESLYYLTSDDYNNSKDGVTAENKAKDQTYYSYSRQVPIPGIRTVLDDSKLSNFVDGNGRKKLTDSEYFDKLLEWCPSLQNQVKNIDELV